MMNNNHENDMTNEIEVHTNGFNNDHSWLHIIILLMLLAIFPVHETNKTNWTEVIKGAAKTIEDFEKAEEAKKVED